MALPEGPTAHGLAALAEAERRVGIVEHPSGSNRGPEIDSWNKAAGVALGSPYCDTFQHDVWKKVGVDLGGNFANADSYCPSTLAWGHSQGYERTRPYKGYLVLFDWNQDGIVDHIGIVKKTLALRFLGARFTGWINTVEANTSGGLQGSQSNGDGVHERKRWVNSSTRFLRVP